MEITHNCMFYYSGRLYWKDSLHFHRGETQYLGEVRLSLCLAAMLDNLLENLNAVSPTTTPAYPINPKPNR